jgi:hypothetical protein
MMRMRWRRWSWTREKGIEPGNLMAVSTNWQRLKGQNQLPKVVRGAIFCDGVEVETHDQSAS